MGLDMSLYKRKKNSKEDEREEICYWRKANAILNWFDHNLNSVKNQTKDESEVGTLDRDGVQNNIYYQVDKYEYEKLLADCKELLIDKNNTDCNELLEFEDRLLIPADLRPTEGFFFGTYDIDDWYWENIQDTVMMLEEAMPNIDWDNDIVEFYISY